MQFQREGRTDHFVLKDGRNIAVLDPALPIAAGLHQKSLGQRRQRLFHRRAIGEHQVALLGEREGAPVEVRERNVGRQTHLTRKTLIAHVIGTGEQRRLRLGETQARLAHHAHARRAFDGLDDAIELRGVKNPIVLLKSRSEVDHAKGARAAPEGRHQNVGVVFVGHDSGLAVLGTDEKPPALLFVEQGRKHRVGIEARQAAPHHGAGILDQGRILTIADQGQLL